MFDPYHKWLGIPPHDQPPSHYRLLALAPFERDLDVIEAAADRQMAFIWQYQSGEHAVDAARILNELSVARLCLLKPATKAAYDAQLRGQASAGIPRRTSSTPQAKRPGGKNTKPSATSPAFAPHRQLIVGIGAALVIGVLTVLVTAPSSREKTRQITASERETSVPPTSSTAMEEAAEPVLQSAATESVVSNLELHSADTQPETTGPAVPVEISPIAAEAVMAPDEVAVEAAALRAPVPSPERQTELSALLKNYDLANLPGIAKKQEAVAKLVEMSRDNSLASDERYVVLKTLIAVATAASDATAFMDAVDQMVTTYDVDRHQEEPRLLIEFMRVGKLGPQLQPVIDSAVACARSAAEEERFAEAMPLIAAADSAVRKASSLDDLKKAVTQARDAIASREKAWKHFEAAKLTLSTNANDPAANFHVGSWHAVHKRDWPLALPFLALGKEESWKAAAELERAAPTDATEQVAIGNAWFDIAETEKISGAIRPALLVHAGEWYEKALPHLASALDRQTVTDRLAMIAPFKAALQPKADTPNNVPGARPGEWIDLLAWAEGVDWSPRGIDWNSHLENPPTKAGLTLKQMVCGRFPLPAFIEGDYEAEFEFTRLQGSEGVSFFFPVLSHNLQFELDRSGFDLVGWLDGQRSEHGIFGKQPSLLAPRNVVQRVRIETHVDGDQARFSIDVDDHRNYFDWEGPYARLRNAEWGGWKTSMIRHVWVGAARTQVRFSKIRLRMLSGAARRDSITDADRRQDLKQGFVRLVGASPSGAVVGWSSFLVNQVPLEFGPGSLEQSWPRIKAFSVCEDYYGAHAPSVLRCPLPRGAKSFSAVGYCDTESHVQYLVCFDGKVSYASGPTNVAVIKLDIPENARSMELIIDPAGNKFHDHSYWCYPRFHSVAAKKILDAMLVGTPSPLEFSINENTVGEMTLTHNEPIRTTRSAPVKLRDIGPCDEFLFAHAPSSLIYEVPKGMTRFSAIGFNACSHHTKFEVWADAKRIFESPQAGITPIDVKLPPGTKNLALKVNSLGDQHHDLSFWCYPRLHLK